MRCNFLWGYSRQKSHCVRWG